MTPSATKYKSPSFFTTQGNSLKKLVAMVCKSSRGLSMYASCKLLDVQLFNNRAFASKEKKTQKKRALGEINAP